MMYGIETKDTLVGRYFTSFNSFLNEVEYNFNDKTNWTTGATRAVEFARAALWRIREGSKKEVKELFQKIQTYQKNTERKYTKKLSIIGVEPCVPNFVAGLPNNMYDINITRRRQQQIDIMLIYNFASAYSPEQLEKLYRILAPLLIILKDKHYHTNVNILLPLEDSTVPIVINIVNNNKMDILAMEAITNIEDFMRGLCFFYARCLGTELSMSLGHPVTSDAPIDGVYNTQIVNDVCTAMGTNYLTINCAMMVDILNQISDENDMLKLVSRLITIINNKSDLPVKRKYDCRLRKIS